MNLRRILFPAVLVGVLTAAMLPALSRATSPGSNGRIAYMRKDRNSHWQIWVANSRLSGGRKLTRGDYDSGWPVWSPGGKWIAFDSNRTDRTPNDSKRVNDVFVMKPDGSGLKKLTDSKGVSGDAAWSPDGSLIAMDADRGTRKRFSAIYVIRANGQKLRRLTKPAPPLRDYKPRFSPDGRHLVFVRARGTAESAPAALFTVRLDGDGLRRLTSFAIHADDSDWSPDGKRIVFDAYPNPGAYGDIYVVDASGGRPVDLTRNPIGRGGSADPVWSPDGRKILFLDNRRVRGAGRTGLATMSPNGSARHFISKENVEAHQADWESIAAAKHAPQDRGLASKLVIAKSDLPGYMGATRGGFVRRCLATTGYTPTAWAGSPDFATPHTGVESIAEVFETASTAKRYYRFATKRMHGCLARSLRQVSSPPTVGRVCALTLPRFGAESGAWRLPYDFEHMKGIHEYTDDWVVVRKRRAVLVDLFGFYVGWPGRDPGPIGFTVRQEERRVLTRQLARGAHRRP